MKENTRAVIRKSTYRVLESAAIITILAVFVYFITCTIGWLSKINLIEGYLEAASSAQISETDTPYVTYAPLQTGPSNQTPLESDVAQQLFNP